MTESRPLLIITQAVVESYRREDFRDVREAIIGVIFLGTPHFGSNFVDSALMILAWFSTQLLGSMVSRMLSLKDLHDILTQECEEEDTELDLWRNSRGFREARPKTLFSGLFSLGLVCGDAA